VAVRHESQSSIYADRPSSASGLSHWFEFDPSNLVQKVNKVVCLVDLQRLVRACLFYSFPTLLRQQVCEKRVGLYKAEDIRQIFLPLALQPFLVETRSNFTPKHIFDICNFRLVAEHGVHRGSTDENLISWISLQLNSQG